MIDHSEMLGHEALNSLGKRAICFNLISALNRDSFPSLDKIGLSFRTPKRGPELTFVCEYIQSCLLPIPQGQSITIFLEPKINSCFPDIVIIYWDNVVAKNRSKHRSQLRKNDIRLLHYIAIAGPVQLDEMKPFFTSGIEGSLTRLCDANLIKNDSGVWQTEPLEDIFAIRRLIAIEAKIDEWRTGLNQAHQNTWFSSESYLLMPQIPKGSSLMGEATKLGVGVLSRHQDLDSSEIAPRRDRIPKSYASWLFNEWVCMMNSFVC
ncbi:MAG TPA: hypothetical protein VE262_21870 [Blastocatellia bacterium]|nr:hypothetical protein [Blastocatellia bacterium]